MLLKLVRLTKLLKSKSRLACPCGHRCGDDAKICGSSSNSTRGRRPLGDEGSKETASSNHQGGLQNNDSFFRKPTSAPCTKSRLDPEAFKAQLDVSSQETTHSHTRFLFSFLFFFPEINSQVLQQTRPGDRSKKRGRPKNFAFASESQQRTCYSNVEGRFFAIFKIFPGHGYKGTCVCFFSWFRKQVIFWQNLCPFPSCLPLQPQRLPAL